MELSIADRRIGPEHPTYFIADIAASHDGELDRAIDLIHLAAEAGADAAKFQNFTAPEIVSDRGFAELGGKLGHQSSWTKPVTQVYAEASIPYGWTPRLKAACDEAGIHYFSSAYDFASVDMLEPHVPAYKIGSGDVTWIEAIEYTASKGKPMLVATGASSIQDVVAAVDAVRRHTDQLVLMQCNTNYTGSDDNFRFISLNVLHTYAAMFPDVVMGLSDHTPGHATTLGAIALGARVIEKHFTDDTGREGPDHVFSMDPRTWREMVDRARELEASFGQTVKRIEENEVETVIVQRRAVRARRPIAAGSIITREDLAVLRPASPHLVPANELERVVGALASRDLSADEGVAWGDFSPAP
ncbi:MULTISPECIES: N-acetylneuraminate synthase family protein [unclassified Microbacterium]|uniref:N-acetylneuraminate synthase family protein n=1 Tax=unclassified Microbacterium TaxID=2609290 RepID=UPI000CFDEC7B|nr:MULTISPECIES: N-acetylneuraminate synthase family protein [unclassified Microbacterium]PQZ59102.1 N-acetylneuraminate synthase [Microbacterium sp. MYb43]PQZ81194.1 N-acetylneuraminate synthase [Microbacterium sp. MYb40]PRB21801.1 N-acetylneuraminate synthase [Microbacterium sp. MYb54]PRB31560.1 N-acetylneuraminate synthase [Microbacterium sp. MYb50]PRB68438.1 N-acetylneuraminate synthase [Microbacterium sp. MYb24]